MIGHETLIAMRRRGLKPDRVTVETDWDLGLERECATEWHLVNPRSAFIFVQPADPVATLDLRCLVGMHVEVCGMDSARVRAVFAACVKAKASRIIGSTHRHRGELVETFESMDTEGQLVWHE
jgi:hypothetical protein